MQIGTVVGAWLYKLLVEGFEENSEGQIERLQVGWQLPMPEPQPCQAEVSVNISNNHHKCSMQIPTLVVNRSPPASLRKTRPIESVSGNGKLRGSAR